MVCQGRKENLMILKDLYIGQNLDHLRYKFTIHLEPPSDGYTHGNLSHSLVFVYIWGRD